MEWLVAGTLGLLLFCLALLLGGPNRTPRP